MLGAPSIRLAIAIDIGSHNVMRAGGGDYRRFKCNTASPASGGVNRAA